MSRVRRTWTVENIWACGSCSASNRGRDLNCRNCGKRKAAEVRDRVPDPEAAPEVKAPALLRQARAGANWKCPYCGGQERDLEGDCTLCGGRRASSSHENTPGPTYSRPAAFDVREPLWRKPAAVFLAGLVFLGLVVWLVAWCATPRTAEVRVDRLSWTYTEHLRARETRHGEEWGRPGSKGFYSEAAFNVSCVEKQRGTKKCKPYDCNPHDEPYDCRPHDCRCRKTCSDNGNGYSSCQERCDTCYETCYETVYDTCYKQCPVYDDWCSYDYHEWPVEQTKTTSGNDHKVAWPGLVAADEKHRVQRVEAYAVEFVRTTGKETFPYHPSTLADFKRFFVGDAWKIEISKIRGRVTPVKITRTTRVEETP